MRITTSLRCPGVSSTISRHIGIRSTSLRGMLSSYLILQRRSLRSCLSLTRPSSPLIRITCCTLCLRATFIRMFFLWMNRHRPLSKRSHPSRPRSIPSSMLGTASMYQPTVRACSSIILRRRSSRNIRTKRISCPVIFVTTSNLLLHKTS